MTVLNDVKKGRAAYFWLKDALSRYLLGSKTPTSKFSVRWGRAAGKRTIGEG